MHAFRRTVAPLSWLFAIAAACVPFALTHARALPPLQAVAQVDSGYAHSCALTTAGAVLCWGSNHGGRIGDGTTYDRLLPAGVAGLNGSVTAISVGDFHACALTAVGGVKCWGSNNRGQLGDGSTTARSVPVDVTGLGSGVVAVSAGGQHTCAVLGNGSARCWGANDEGWLGDGSMTDRPTPVTPTGLGSGIAAISAGGTHTCALTSGGGVKCWGSGRDGQIGDGSLLERLTPTDVPTLGTGVAKISAGRLHVCAVLTGGGAKCWGGNNAGQIGNGTSGFLSPESTPVDVTGLTSGIARISAGGNHTCAMTTGGGVRCWGENLEGQIGDATLASRLTPRNVTGLASGATAIAVGESHSCAVTTDGTALCWGSNVAGQLGDGDRSVQFAPVAVSGQAAGIAQIAGGSKHSCLLTTGGGVKCWGANLSGELGDGTTTQRLVPVGAAGLGSGVTAIASNHSHTCALTAAGGVKCWGSNFRGQLGDGSTTLRTAPVDVAGLTSGVAAIAVGDAHSCAVTQAGGVKCWGSNSSRELGDGSTTDRPTPVDVSGLGNGSGVTAISVGRQHACALVAGGVKCWGSDASGQLGDGSGAATQPPAVDPVGLGSGVAAISAGGAHTCALTTGGTVKCWGLNGNGQLGDGTTTGRDAPTDVPGITGVVEIRAANEAHTCARLAGGAVKCWGYNEQGQLGLGNATFQQLSPADVAGLADAASIAAGRFHSCAVTTAGAALCWGKNSFGQLGIGGRSYVVPGEVLTDDAPRTVAPLTPAGDGGSLAPRTDASGRYVVFQSSASNLLGAGGDANGGSDVFRLDRATGVAIAVSVNDDESPGGGGAIEPAVSADGNAVVFVAPEGAVTKVWGESKAASARRIKAGGFGVFLRNLLTGTTQRVGSGAAAGAGTKPQISPDGSTVVFTAPNTSPAFGAPGQDNIVKVPLMRVGNNLLPQPAECVSCKARSPMGAPVDDADGPSRNAVVSSDGRYVAYETTAKNVVAGTTSPCAAAPSAEIILRDLLLGTSQRISPPPGLPAINCGTSGSAQPSIDWSGRFIAFRSDQPLKPGSATGRPEIFLADGGFFARISEQGDGSASNGGSDQPVIAGDGSTIAFVSTATDLDGGFVDSNAQPDLHAWRRSGGVQRLSLSTTGAQANAAANRPALNYNATLLVFDSAASNLVAGDVNAQVDVFQRALPATVGVVFSSGFD